MKLPVGLRKAEQRDAPDLARIGYDAWEAGILPLLSETSGLRQTERRRLTHITQETIPRIVVAEIDGEAVGWCSRARGRAYIPFLFVAPPFQNRGIGSLLLRRVESMIELGGARAVVLETPADNVRAVRFYQHQGYRILALKTDGRSAHEPFMSVRLEKSLQPFTGKVTDAE